MASRYEVKTILDRRTMEDDSIEYLVKWEGFEDRLVNSVFFAINVSKVNYKAQFSQEQGKDVKIL